MEKLESIISIITSGIALLWIISIAIHVAIINFSKNKDKIKESAGMVILLGIVGLLSYTILI